LVWGLGGRNATQVGGKVPRKGSAKAPFLGLREVGDGCRESEVSLARDQTPICLYDDVKAQRRASSLALGDKTGERSSPLFMIVWYYHTHLAVHLNFKIW